VKRAVRLAFWVGVAAMVGFSAVRLRITTDVTHFLPDRGATELAALSRQLAQSELARTMVIGIGGQGPADALVEAARALEERLRGDPEVAWIRSGSRPEQLEELYQLYFPRRYYFLAPDPEREIPALLAPERLRERAERARSELALPSSPLLEGLVAADPLGAFRAILERLGPPPRSLAELDGHFVSREGDLAIFLLGTRHSAFDSRAQRALLARIELAFGEIDAASAHELRLVQSGGNRIAVHAEDRITRDVYLIAAVSLIGVAALFLIFFRSVHGFGLALIPPLTGLGFATTCGLLWSGTVDGLTLAFGASLVGVAIDYPIHLINHHALSEERDGYAVARALAPAMWLGALTTMASFAGLLLTSFPGFREIGSFSILAVLGALLTTRYVLPAFLSERTAPPASLRIALRLGRVAQALRRRRALTLAALCALSLGGALALPSLIWNDDLSALASLDPDLLAEDAALRRRVAPFETGRLVIALAPDLESALERNGEVYARLERAREAGAFEAMRSLHALLWPRELQLRNRRALEREPRLAERVTRAFVGAGFRPDALAPFRASLSQEPPPPLRLGDLQRSPLAALFEAQVLRLEGRVGVVTFLRGVRDLDALERSLAGLAGVHVFDQRAFANQIFAEFRATTVRQISVGCALVLLTLLIRYRALRPSLIAFFPSILGALVLLGGFALAGVETNLLHVVSLNLVMGMSVDYGVFLVESPRDARHLSVTLLSVLLGCLTTLLALGTLALSDHVALRAIGLTTGIGILLALLFAPATWAALMPPARAR
jgi:predicted exporter